MIYIDRQRVELKKLPGILDDEADPVARGDHARSGTIKEKYFFGNSHRIKAVPSCTANHLLI